MPIISLWTLVIGCGLLALGLTYKNADIRHTLKRTKDELSAARSEITTLNEKQNKQIQNIEMKHDTRIKELLETISKLEKKLAEKKPSGHPPHIPNFTDTQAYKLIGGDRYK